MNGLYLVSTSRIWPKSGASVDSFGIVVRNN